MMMYFYFLCFIGDFCILFLVCVGSTSGSIQFKVPLILIFLDDSGIGKAVVLAESFFSGNY